jgi:hypothetical protein
MNFSVYDTWLKKLTPTEASELLVRLLNDGHVAHGLGELLLARFDEFAQSMSCVPIVEKSDKYFASLNSRREDMNFYSWKKSWCVEIIFWNYL